MSPQRRSTDQPESRRSRRRVTLAAVLAGVAVAAAFAAAGFALWLNSNRTTQIQEERAANVRRSCEDVNKRHDDTIRALDRLLSQAQQRASREQIARSRASTTLLIDALAPKRDCSAIVRQQVATN